MTTTMEAPTFDAARYKQTTHDQWQSAAGAWNEWGPFLRKWLGESTEALFDMAGIAAGSRVLDVAAGAGDQTLLVADRVGPQGYVLATDISPAILEHAARNARNAGLSNVETKVLDGENLDVPEGSFDAVISRVGLIYFPDQQAALRGMKRALKPGGRVAAMVYSTPDKNAFFSIPVSIIRSRANLPPPQPGQPGPFSLGAPGVLEEAFRAAGFGEVKTQRLAAPLRMSSAMECVRFERESFGALHQMLSVLDPQARSAAWEEIAAKLRQFENNGEFQGPCEMVIGVGVK